MNLAVEIINEDDKICFLLDGEIDAYTAPILKERLLPIFDEKDQQVYVNLEKVKYMDSTGLGVFIGAFKKAHQNNGRLIIGKPQPRIARLFDVTGLSKIMEVETNE